MVNAIWIEPMLYNPFSLFKNYMRSNEKQLMVFVVSLCYEKNNLG